MRNLVSKGLIAVMAHFFHEFNTFFFSGFLLATVYCIAYFTAMVLFSFISSLGGYINEIHIFIIFISKPNISLHKIGLCDGCFQVTLLTNSFLCGRNHDMISELFLVLSPITGQKQK